MSTEEETLEELPKGSNKFVLIVIVNLLIGAGVIAYLLLRPTPGQAKSNAGEQEQPMAAALAGTGPLLALDSFIVNLADVDITRYLKVSITLELSQEGLQESISKRKPLIRDAIITLIGSKTFHQIRSPKGKQELREAIVKSLGEVAGAGRVRKVYFTEFVVQ